MILNGSCKKSIFRRPPKFNFMYKIIQIIMLLQKFTKRLTNLSISTKKMKYMKKYKSRWGVGLKMILVGFEESLKQLEFIPNPRSIK